MVKQDGKEEPARQCYEGQVGQPNVWSSGRLREELDKIGLGCTWQNMKEMEVKTLCHVINTRRKNIQRQRWWLN
jgi:hypothetical protein